MNELKRGCQENKLLVLAIDTSSPYLSVALGDHDRIIKEISIEMPRGTMAEILPTIENLLESNELSIDDIKVIVVGTGPGSYTGLRIGVVVARSLAQTIGIPIIGVPSLDAIAYRNANPEVLVCPIVDAKRNEVFAAIYCMDVNGLKRLEEFKTISPLELAESLKIEEFDKVILAGDGVGIYGEAMAEYVSDSIEFATESLWWPNASDLISIAFSRINDKHYDDPYLLSPIYVRLSQAEEMWEKRRRGESK